jgi:putative DNA-invertase from lambdoid prophage Rac
MLIKRIQKSRFMAQHALVVKGYPMYYAYLRVSTDKQTTDQQRFEILKYADANNLIIDYWIEETVRGTRKVSDRKLGQLIAAMHAQDVLLVTELSRLGRSLMEVMSILHTLMERAVTVQTLKEGYTLGNTLNAKILAFAFRLAAEVERAMISQRTKEALARKRSEGKRLGRPKGSRSKTTKLTGKEAIIAELVAKQVSMSAIARILGVHRKTIAHYLQQQRRFSRK